MDKIAWILGDVSIRWSPFLLMLAVLSGILFFFSAGMSSKRPATAQMPAVPLALILSMFFGKILHGYFLPDAPEGYVLMGAFAGCLCAVGILKLVGVERNPGRLLDQFAIGGSAAIGLGRLSGFFTAENRGQIVTSSFGRLFAAQVTNVTSGETEERLAVFLLQAIAAGLIFLILLAVDRKNRKMNCHRDGDVALLYLLTYTASQIVLDSLRYDALHLRSNGFIGAVQLCCALTFVCVIGILASRGMRKKGFRILPALTLLLIGVCIGVAGYMEYFVQRHGAQALLGYAVMSAAMLVATAAGVFLWRDCETNGAKAAQTGKPWHPLVTGVVSLVCIPITVCLLLSLLRSSSTAASIQTASGEQVMDQFFMNTTNALLEATSDIRNTQKRYWISEDANRAPKPNRDNYGRTTNPEEIRQVIADAETLLEGQPLYFDPEVQTLNGSDVRYYRDDTILCITWKQNIHNSAYSFSEVKIADPSQLRRYFSGGEYGSSKLVYPTEMANSVNSVCAISGDYYMYRNAGVIVYKGNVYRSNMGADTCYVDRNGDLLFTPFSKRMELHQAQSFVDENDILFSVAFGPILVENGERHEFGAYGLGEVSGNFSRAAICQLDSLHYLLVNATSESGSPSFPTMYSFQDVILSTGCQSAYALDGGQTAAMMMNGELINSVYGGSQRKISDIIYFCTAMPNS